MKLSKFYIELKTSFYRYLFKNKYLPIFKRMPRSILLSLSETRNLTLIRIYTHQCTHVLNYLIEIMKTETSDLKKKKLRHPYNTSLCLSLYKNTSIFSLFYELKGWTFTFSSPLTVDRSCLSAKYKSKNGRPPYSVRYTGTPAAHERRREDDYDGITLHFSFSFWFFGLQPRPGCAAAAATPPCTSVQYWPGDVFLATRHTRVGWGFFDRWK